MHAIEVSHIFKQFGALTALNDINFTVSEGETFGFLGPNGAGKTTTIRILTGSAHPPKGLQKFLDRTSYRRQLPPANRWVLFTKHRTSTTISAHDRT